MKKLFLALTVLLCITSCSKDEEPEPPYITNPQSGGSYVPQYYIYRLSGDYSDNVCVDADITLLKGGERIIGKLYGSPTPTEDRKSPVKKLHDGFYEGGGVSYRTSVFLTLKWSEFDDWVQAARPEKYGYAIIPEARMTEEYGIETKEFWRLAEELYPEVKEKYGHYWGSPLIGDIYEITLNRLIDEGLRGFEKIYDEETYDPGS